MSHIDDELGDRIKGFESVETDRMLDPSWYTAIRVDGKAFSTFTSGLGKPFDRDLADVFAAVAEKLILEFRAPFAYAQSDEITLVLPPRELPQVLPYGGRVFKLIAEAATVATSAFVVEAIKRWPDRVADLLPRFDARVFSVPTLQDAADVILWRAKDAERNAVSMVAQACFPHGELQGVPTWKLIEMLKEERGVDYYAAYPARFRHGLVVRRRKVEKELEPEVLAKIPAHKRPAGPVLRSKTVFIEPPRLSKVENLVEHLFEDQEPRMVEAKAVQEADAGMAI